MYPVLNEILLQNGDNHVTHLLTPFYDYKGMIFNFAIKKKITENVLTL